MAERYRKPQTIDELKQFCAEKGMPLEKMRFFIGEDYPHPRAFGIYEDADGDFVVYKNKADGTRAVRYKGPNEVYAVNELYEKLKAETDMRRNASGASARSGGKNEKEKSGPSFWLVACALIMALALFRLGLVALFLIVPIGILGFMRSFVKKELPRGSGKATIAIWTLNTLIGMFLLPLVFGIISGKSAETRPSRPDRGYYIYEEQPYYYYRGDWYEYGNYYSEEQMRVTRGWHEVDDVDFALEESYGDYYVSEDYDSGYGVTDFEDSSYWIGYDDNYYDSDDDYDWGWSSSDSGWDSWDSDSGSDWDSWDSSDTDWDSDW